MNIYFAGSIRGGRDLRERYEKVINLLGEKGKVLTEHIGDKNLSERGEVEHSDELIFKRDVDFIDESDVVIAEVTQPSLGVGYEIGYAESKGKKIICLCEEREGARLSAMVAGNKNLQVFTYKTEEDLFAFIKNLNV